MGVRKLRKGFGINLGVRRVDFLPGLFRRGIADRVRPLFVVFLKTVEGTRRLMKGEWRMQQIGPGLSFPSPRINKQRPASCGLAAPRPLASPGGRQM